MAKNQNGYVVLGHIENNIIKIKSYESLKTENFQIRINRKISDNVVQYLARIGQHKIILNVSDEGMEYLMDLC